jgi:murein DD-endopeptidase MepM/ murein hydrolase activator NlpD
MMIRLLACLTLFGAGFGSGVYFGRQGVLHHLPQPDVVQAQGDEPRFIQPPQSESTIGLPITGLKRSDILDTFDQKRGKDRKHEATDIMAPHGTPVLAVVDGTIAKLFHSEGGGGMTIYLFDRDQEHAYYYAHLSGYRDGLTEGTRVRRGDVIGYVGSTGNASPDAPHLHFGVFELGPEKHWWRGTPINPYPLLVEAVETLNR